MHTTNETQLVGARTCRGGDVCFRPSRHINNETALHRQGQPCIQELCVGIVEPHISAGVDNIGLFLFAMSMRRVRSRERETVRHAALDTDLDSFSKGTMFHTCCSTLSIRCRVADQEKHHQENSTDQHYLLRPECFASFYIAMLRRKDACKRTYCQMTSMSD